MYWSCGTRAGVRAKSCHLIAGSKIWMESLKSRIETSTLRTFFWMICEFDDMAIEDEDMDKYKGFCFACGASSSRCTIDSLGFQYCSSSKLAWCTHWWCATNFFVRLLLVVVVIQRRFPSVAGYFADNMARLTRHFELWYQCFAHAVVCQLLLVSKQVAIFFMMLPMVFRPILTLAYHTSADFGTRYYGEVERSVVLHSLWALDSQSLKDVQDLVFAVSTVHHLRRRTSSYA